MILILDFGSQVTQLIGRRLRELNVYCEIHPYNKIPDIGPNVKGVILSGSPFSVRDEKAPVADLSAIKGKLPLYRFYMGLAFQMEGNNVGCYLEEYDPVHHIDSLLVQKQDDKEVTPAETRCWLRYYTWDENTNHMVIINPALQEDRMTDTEDGKRLDRAFQVIAYDKNQQERVNKLGLQLVVKYNSKGEPYYILRCRFGVLNAPNRIFGYIQCRCILGGKECVATRPVLLLSQPKPSFRSPAKAPLLV